MLRCIFCLPDAKPHYIAKDLIAVRTPISVLFLDVDTDKDIISESSRQQEQRLFANEGESFTAIGTNPYKQILAVAVRGDVPEIRFFHYPNLEECYAILRGESIISYKLIAISNDATRVCLVSDIPNPMVEYWDIGSEELLCSNPVPENVNRLHISPQSNECFFTMSELTVTMWKVFFKFEQYFLSTSIYEFPERDERRAVGAAWSDKNTILIATNLGELISYNGDSNPHIQQIKDCPEIVDVLHTRRHTITVHKNEMRWLRKNNLNEDAKVELTGDVKYSVFAPGYRSLLVVDYSLRLWVIKVSGQLVMGLATMQEDPLLVRKFVYSPFISGRPLGIVPTTEKTTCMFMTEKEIIAVDIESLSWQVVKELPKICAITYAVFKHSVTAAIALDFGAVALCDVSTIRLCRVMEAERFHTGPVSRLKFNEDGSVLCSVGSSDHRIFFINVQDFTPMGYIEISAVPKCICFAILHGAEKLLITQEVGVIKTVDVPPKKFRRSGVANELKYVPTVVENDMPCDVDHIIEYGSDSNQIIVVGEDGIIQFVMVDSSGMMFVDYCIDSEAEEHCSDSLKTPNYLILCFNDGTLQFRPWEDLNDCSQIIYAHNHRTGLGMLALLSSGTLLVTIGNDHTFKSWLMPEGASKVESKHRVVHKGRFDKKVLLTEEALPPYEQKWTVADAKQGKAGEKLEALREKVQTWRKTFEELKQRNNDASELERLEPHELIIDHDELERMEEITENQVIAVKKEVQKQILSQTLVTRRIMEQCWNTATSHGNALFGLQNEDLMVQSFPILKPIKSVSELLGKIKYLREMNRMERTFSSKKLDNDLDLFEFTPAECKYLVNVPEGEVKGKQYEEDDQILNNLHHPMQLFANVPRRMQADMLKVKVRKIKENFNRDFDKLVKMKEQERIRIADINKDLQTIYTELGVKEDLFIPKTFPSEDPEEVLHVKASEVKVERVLTKEERDAKEAEEDARLKEEMLKAKDDAPKRALQDMMGGTLKSKNDMELLAAALVKPEFLGILAEENWNEAQIAEAALYNEKKVELEKAKLVRKKMLETQMKKLKNDIGDICRGFDSKLRAAFNNRHRCMERATVIEMDIVRICNSIVEEEQIEKRLKLYDRELHRFQVEKEKADTTNRQFFVKLQDAKKHLETLLLEEKALERNFKRDLPDAGESLDQLRKLFKGKKPGSRAKRKADIKEEFELTEEEAFDPYCEVMRKSLPVEEQHEKPDGLSEVVWENFLQLLKVGTDLRKEVKVQQAVVQSMENEVVALQKNQTYIEKSISELLEAKKSLLRKREAMLLNTELMIQCKQGQVEVEECPVVTDMRRAALIHRETVEVLNTQIRSIGEEKVAKLQEIKDFRRGINMLRWKAKSLDLDLKYYKHLTMEYQLRRVSKQDQEIIQMGGYESKQKAEISSLERKLAFFEKTSKQSMEEIKAKLSGLKRQGREQKDENKQLALKIAELQRDVMERVDIRNIRGGGRSVAEEKELNAQKRMDSVVTRRQLLDLVKAQADEIQFLRSELDRLRRSTFPSFTDPNQAI